MKKIKNWHVYVITFLIVLVLGYQALGWFTDLKIKEQELSGYTVAYVSFSGSMLAYHRHVDKVENELESKNIKGIWEMSIYYNLYTDKRSGNKTNDAGIVVDPQDIAKLDKDSSVYKIMTISAGKKMVINFPYKWAFSCMVGHIRWTKAMHEYLKLHNNEYATVIELYNTQDNIIYYITELQK